MSGRRAPVPVRVAGVSRPVRHGGSARRWWITWPGALGLGAVCLAAALPGVVALVGTALLPAEDALGIDVVRNGPGTLTRAVMIALAVAVLAVPVLTTVWARKKWAGYVLLGVGASIVVGCIGLAMLGIL